MPRLSARIRELGSCNGSVATTTPWEVGVDTLPTCFCKHIRLVNWLLAGWLAACSRSHAAVELLQVIKAAAYRL